GTRRGGRNGGGDGTRGGGRRRRRRAGCRGRRFRGCRGRGGCCCRRCCCRRGGLDHSASHPLTRVSRRKGFFIRPGRAVLLLVAGRGDVGEVVGPLVNDQRGLLATQQILRGERVGGGGQQRRSIRAHLQRSQVAAGRLAGMASRLEVSARGIEITRSATGGWSRVG